MVLQCVLMQEGDSISIASHADQRFVLGAHSDRGRNLHSVLLKRLHLRRTERTVPHYCPVLPEGIGIADPLKCWCRLEDSNL